MTTENKRIIVTTILELAQKNKLSINQKQKFYRIIINSDRTNIQKDRFIKYYNLDVNNNESYNYTRLAKEYGRTREAIKQSLESVIIYTLLKDENIKKFKEILKEILEEA